MNQLKSKRQNKTQLIKEREETEKDSPHVLFSLVHAHKPHGAVTPRQLLTPHKLRGEQMLTRFNWCGKCQHCRWRRDFFIYLPCCVSPGPVVTCHCGAAAQHLIHKHGGEAEDAVVD